MFILNSTVNGKEWAKHIPWSCCIVGVIHGEDIFYKSQNLLNK